MGLSPGAPIHEAVEGGSAAYVTPVIASPSRSQRYWRLDGGQDAMVGPTSETVSATPICGRPATVGPVGSPGSTGGLEKKTTKRGVSVELLVVFEDRVTLAAA